MPAPHLILYDGVCGLCSRFVQFVLKRDKREQFLFAPLQSETAAQELARHGYDAQALDTVYLITDRGTPAERIHRKARAVLMVLRLLGGFWRVPAAVRILPARVNDWGYDLIARHRYRLFGRTDSCPLPKPEHRRRFLET